MTFWSWISMRRRREILDMYIRHVERVIEVVNHAEKLIEALVEGNEEEVLREWQNVFESERKADESKRNILAELSKEIFHPIDREELVRLIIMTDDIADYAKAWSRRAVLYTPNKTPNDIGKKLTLMSKKVLDAVNLIKQAVDTLVKDPRKVLEIANSIESLEEEVDDIRHDLFKSVLSFCNNAQPSQCILIKELMDSIENAADKCEDVGDLFRRIALLSI
ncbi:MAG: DUF47 family protein [Ignisphaera sp.]